MSYEFKTLNDRDVILLKKCLMVAADDLDGKTIAESKKRQGLSRLFRELTHYENTGITGKELARLTRHFNTGTDFMQDFDAKKEKKKQERQEELERRHRLQMAYLRARTL